MYNEKMYSLWFASFPVLLVILDYKASLDIKI